MTVAPTLRELVTAAIDRQGWSLREAERQTGGRISRDTLSRLVTGRTRHVKPDTLVSLHEVLRIPMSKLRAANGQSVRDVPAEPFTLPRRADALTLAERLVVVSMVDALLAAHRAGRRP